MTAQKKTTSTCRAAANRVNGRASRGPKTIQGKARASQNARRHGLSLSVAADPELLKEVASLAREIANGATDPEVLGLAGAVAEAQIDLKRIRQVRGHLLAQNITDRDDQTPNELQQSESEAVSPDLVKQLLALDRYERRAFSRRKYAIRKLRVALELSRDGNQKNDGLP